MDDDHRRPNLFVPGYSSADLEDDRSGKAQDPQATAAFAEARLRNIWPLIFDICERHGLVDVDLRTADPATLPREVLFAQVMRSEVRRTEKALASGDAADAFNTGFRLAKVTFQWQAEFALGADIWRGRKAVANASEGGEKRARVKSREAATLRAERQALADAIWSRRPGWSRTNVAREIARKIGGNPDTIRKSITEKVGI